MGGAYAFSGAPPAATNHRATYADDHHREFERGSHLFVAPALLDAAFDTSPRDLRRNTIPIASLAVVAVVLTTAAVAFLGRHFTGLPTAANEVLSSCESEPAAIIAVDGKPKGAQK